MLYILYQSKYSFYLLKILLLSGEIQYFCTIQNIFCFADKLSATAFSPVKNDLLGNVKVQVYYLYDFSQAICFS